MKKIQLSIPEPCQQHWDDMTPTQQGRFCNACAKQVIDFSEMSDTEVLNYFSKTKEENVCGRVYPDQLERTITALPKKKIYWYLHYVIAFFLFFGKANGSKAQRTKGMVLPKPVGALKQAPVKEAIAKKFIINDVIADEHGKPIPFASVRLLNSTVGVSADEQGKFTLKIDELNCSIEVSALNYETKQVVIYDVSEREIVLTRSNELMKDVVVITNTGMGRLKGSVTCQYKVMGAMSTVVTTKKSVTDTISNWISNFNPSVKTYPNPATRGSAFTVAVKLKETGHHTIQVSDATGTILLQKQVNAISKEHREQLQGNSNWSAGIYYVKVMDEKGKLIGTGSVLLQ